MISTMNRHSRRESMELVAVTRPEGLLSKPLGLSAILVEPFFGQVGRDAFEEILAQRHARWSSCEAGGGFVLGELL